MNNVYQFAFHENVSSTKPNYPRKDALMKKLNEGVPLTRQEKDDLVDSFYGTFGQRHGATIRYAGWIWDFRPFTKTYLVKQYGGWQEYQAFDKTSLRKALYGRIEAIVEV